MRVVQINGGVVGSTGGIMLGLSDAAKKNNIETFCFSPVIALNRKGIRRHYCGIGTFNSRRMNVLADRLTGLSNCFAIFSTMCMLRMISYYRPDVIHLHNLHEAYVNLSLLFHYIKKRNIPVVWTLHDCWTFTGHCPHFDMVDCDKWKTGCHGCPQYRDYPKSLFDNSKIMYKLKKKWFTGVSNMTIVTPSKWLADLVGESFLKEYPVRVINNGIDLSIFKPTVSDFKERYDIMDKHIILGVAFGWGKRKGLDVFIELSHRLDRKKYQIILVGTDDSVDKKLPDNIISIHRTQDQKELAKIYSIADVFVNPTREETLGMVNVEANACGTPIVTFNTGGSPECIDSTSGSVVEKDDIDAMEKEIIRICETKPYLGKECAKRAKHFDRNARFKEYIGIYGEISK